MRKLYNIGLVIILFWMVGCGNEDELTPSGYEKDWTVLEKPSSDDPVDNLRYEIYTNYGISIYFNDTIGCEERVDMSGNEYTYYEILKVYYAPGSSKPGGSYVLLNDHSGLETILSYFNENVFNRFSNGELLPSFLFVDKVLSYPTDAETDAYVGYNTMVVRTEGNFASLDETGKRAYANLFLTNYFSGLLNSSSYTSWREKFLQVTRSLNPSCQFIHSGTVSSGTPWEEAFAGTTFTVKEELGFITDMIVRGESATPTEGIDLTSYVAAVFANTTVEFEEKYSEYDPVMTKFRMVKNMLENLEFQLAD